MHDLLMIARLLLASAFLVAGAGKLLDCTGTRRTLVEAGLSGRVGDLTAAALPVAELGIAAALLSPSAAWWGAVVALGLLTSFSAAIAIAMARGRMAACGCFGRLGGSTSPLASLVRSEMLAALAALVVWQGWNEALPGLAEWVQLGEGSHGLAVVVLLAGFLVAAGAAPLARHIVRAVRLAPPATSARRDGIATSRTAIAPVSGLAVGMPAPRFEVHPRSGGRLSLRALLGEGLPLLVVFSDSRVAAGQALLPMIARWRRDCAGCFQPIVIEDASTEPEGTRPEAATILDAFRVPAVPSAVLVRADGRIASALAVGLTAIESLAGSRRREAIPR